jgi:hypothetical protein
LSMNFLSNQQSFNFHTSSVHNNCLSTFFISKSSRMHSSVTFLKSFLWRIRESDTLRYR